MRRKENQDGGCLKENISLIRFKKYINYGNTKAICRISVSQKERSKFSINTVDEIHALNKSYVYLAFFTGSYYYCGEITR